MDGRTGTGKARCGLEDVFDPLPDAFDDFAGSLRSAFTYVFGAFAGARAGGYGSINRVEGDDIARALRYAASNIPGASGGSLTEIARAAADLAACAPRFLVFVVTNGLSRRVLTGSACLARVV